MLQLGNTSSGTGFCWGVIKRGGFRSVCSFPYYGNSTRFSGQKGTDAMR